MSQEKLDRAKNLFFISLAIDMAVTALVAITDFWAVGVLKDIRAGITKADQSTIRSLEFLESFSKVMILTLIGVGLALVRWLDACYEYAKETLKATGFAQEGWKTWGWIVPFMNVFKPYQVLAEIYRAGATDYLGGEEWKKSSGSGMLLVWWIFWVITHMVMWGIGKHALKSSFKDDLTLSQIIGMYYDSVAVCVISLIVAGMWLLVAGSLTRRLLNRSVPFVGSAAPAHFPAANGAAAPIAPNFTKAISSENLTQSPLQTVVDEECVYAEIAKELETGVANKGLWTRLFAECGGDEKQTKVLYIKARADRLISSERSRLEQAAHAQTAESARLEKLRLQSLPLREKLIAGKITKDLSDSVRALSNTHAAVTVLNKVRLNKLSEVDAMLTEEPLLVAVTNSEGDTPLHIAVGEKYLKMAQLLLEKGAMADAKNMYGDTPIDSANKSGQIEMAKLLMALAH